MSSKSRAQETPSFFDIRSGSAWRMLDLRELWAYRELIYFLTWRDVIRNAGMLSVIEGDFFGSGYLAPSSHGGIAVDHRWEYLPGHE